MTNDAAIIIEDIRKTIAIGQTVYDKQGKKVGMVDVVDPSTGYFSVELTPLTGNPTDLFTETDLYIPFSLITSIDPREIFVSKSRDELRRDYTNPPARSVVVTDGIGGEVATTVEHSGYTGAPIVVEQVRLDQLKNRIVAGDSVYTSDLQPVGKIKQYDPVTGWMLIETGVMDRKHDLMLPVTIVDDVNTETSEVNLAVSQADLRSMQHLEPTYVVFPPARFTDAG